MRLVEKHPEGGSKELVLSDDGLQALSRFLEDEVASAISARSEIESVWNEVQRLYDSRPAEKMKSLPFPGASNLEVSIAGVAVDAIYANALDLVWAVSPVVTVRPVAADDVEDAKAIQKLVNWTVGTESGFKGAAEESVLDCVKLGTGVYYIPWVERVHVTDVQEVKHQGPRIMSVAPEDFFVPGSASADLQEARWVAMRVRLSRSDLELRAESLGWDLEGVQPSGTIPSVRDTREELAHVSTSASELADTFHIFDIYCYHDIDGDLKDESLLVTWDQTSRRILKVRFNPYDRRPFAACQYQRRGHTFYGLGVVEMIRGFQEEVTKTHNNRVDNSYLANTRVFLAADGAAEETKRIWPGKVIHVTQKDDVSALVMADVYPSSVQNEMITLRLAEQRVGLNDLANAQTTGSRVPGITALTLVSQANKRFAAAFDGIRSGASEAERQVLYRYQERLLANDEAAASTIRTVCGEKDGNRVIAALKRDDFDESMNIELTASSASVNRESDRQSQLALVQIMTTYYERMVEIAQLLLNPMLPPQLRAVLERVAKGASELIDRTLRTFDQVRDPEELLIPISVLSPQQQEPPDAAVAAAPGGAGMAGVPPELATAGVVPGMAPEPAGGGAAGDGGGGF